MGSGEARKRGSVGPQRVAGLQQVSRIEVACLRYDLLADVVVGIHFLFVVFVVLGGLLVLRWPKAAYLHIPAALWGAAIEFAGWICPLTPLENWLRRQAGSVGYSGGFIEHYILPVLYPSALSRNIQLLLGFVVIAVNVAIYAYVVRRKAGQRGSGEAGKQDRWRSER